MRRFAFVSALAICCNASSPARPPDNAVKLAPSAPIPTSPAMSSASGADTQASDSTSSEPAQAPEVPPAATAIAPIDAVAFPAFEIETPYLPGQLARPSGKMAASIFDEELARWNIGGSSDASHPSNRAGFHPAARVVVDVSALNRALPERALHGHFASVASLVAEARNQGYWAFRTCFEQGLRTNAELNGQVRMRLRLSTNGRVLSARLSSTRLASRPSVDCIVRAASQLTFRKPPARRVDVELSVKLWPGDAPLPPRSDVAQRGFNPSNVTSALATCSAELAQCCTQALGRDQKLWGRLAFTIQTDADGRVQSARESESRFPDRAASDCMRDTLLRAPALTPPAALQFVYAVRCGHPPVVAPESTPANAPDSVPASTPESAPANTPNSAPEDAPAAAN